MMQQFLHYLSDKKISSDELFIVCNLFRKTMIEFTYTHDFNSQEVFSQLSIIFDANFRSVLLLYNDTIFEKQKLVEASLSLLNEYKNAIDQSNIVSKTDAYGTITYANDAFCQLSGYTLEELLGKSHNIVRHPDTSLDFYRIFWETLRTNHIYKGTIKNRSKTGEDYYLDLTVLPLHTHLDEGREYIAIGYNVTDLILAQQEALLANKAKDTFLTSMSHEIRTPLNAIMGFVPILIEHEQNREFRHYLKIINNSGEHLLGIINDILDFSKLKSGRFTIDNRPFMPHSNFSHVLELFARGAYEKNITLSSFIDPLMPHQLIGDVLRIKQIFANLLSNAIKFTPTNGTINVTITYVNEHLHIEVQDSGIGMTQEQQLRIFEAFTQAAQMPNSSGLGMTISRELTLLMHGELTLRSDFGKGSIFALTLPLRSESASDLFPFDPHLFARLRFGLLIQHENDKLHYAPLERYWQSFGMRVIDVGIHQTGDIDVLVVLDEAHHAFILQHAHTVPTIVLQKKPHQRYEHLPNITSLHYPIHCENIYMTLTKALELETPNNRYSKKSWQRRFQGKVLIAEDNIANQELILLLLKRYGLDTRLVTHGKDAVDLAQRDRFDLIFLDEQMPVMTGSQALVAIRTFDTTTPIVGISANLHNESLANDALNQYNAFLTKPISQDALEEIFARYLVEAEAQQKLHTIDTTSVPSRVDVKRLERELGLTHEDIVQLLGVFFKKIDKSIVQLGHYWEAKDLAAIAKEAHSIKGSAANFRFTTIEIIAKNLETAARSADKNYDYATYIATLAHEVRQMY